jgi:hypothetical protein
MVQRPARVWRQIMAEENQLKPATDGARGARTKKRHVPGREAAFFLDRDT